MVKGDMRRKGMMPRSPAQQRTARCLAESSKRCRGRKGRDFYACKSVEMRSCLTRG